MPREKAQVATTTRPKVPMRRLGADCLVVVMKRGNARGAKGAGHRHWRGSTGNGRNPLINGRRQPSCDGTSRISREAYVRFCERLGVKFPGSTRQTRPFNEVGVMSALLPIATKQRTSNKVGSVPIGDVAITHSITLSATMSRFSGMVRPSALAVLRLMHPNCWRR